VEEESVVAVDGAAGVAVVVVAVDDALSAGTIEGAAGASIMTVRVLVDVRPDWSVAT
jgi:hypothetical protein